MDFSNLSEGWIVSGIGVILSGVHLVHGLGEIADEPLAVLFGVLIPLIVSVYLIVSGYRIVTTTWEPASEIRIVQWCLGGLVIGVGLVSLLVQYQLAEDVILSDIMFVLAMFATYGAAFGIVVGRYDAERQAERLREQRKSERLEEFASIVSHDLRNPLSVAEGRLELAMENRQSEHLEAVARAHARMNHLIEDLLTLAREGDSAVTVEPIDLADLIEGCWNNVATGEATLVSEVDQTIRADPDRLSQVFENLIRNAIQHGGPAVTVTVGELEDGFYVEDDGPGIPSDERDQVFERGYSTTDEGMGFGLAIVREIVENHGWDIEITESDTGGARFEVRTTS